MLKNKNKDQQANFEDDLNNFIVFIDIVDSSSQN